VAQARADRAVSRLAASQRPDPGRRVRRIEVEADAEIAAAVAFAEAGNLEPVEEFERFVTMERVPA
jgi:hypothetical protein